MSCENRNVLSDTSSFQYTQPYPDRKVISDTRNIMFSYAFFFVFFLKQHPRTWEAQFRSGIKVMSLNLIFILCPK